MKTLLFFGLGAIGLTFFTTLSSTDTTEHSLEKKKYKNHLSWKDFEDITYKDVYLKELDAWFWQPEFSEKLKNLEGDTIHIAGFLQNGGTKEEPAYLICHQKHMHMGCCGITGPEDLIVLGAEFKKEDLELEDSILVSGVLQLNEDDVYQLNYILEQTQLVESY